MEVMIKVKIEVGNEMGRTDCGVGDVVERDVKIEGLNDVERTDCGDGDVVERDVVDCELADRKDCRSSVVTASGSLVEGV